MGIQNATAQFVRLVANAPITDLKLVGRTCMIFIRKYEIYFADDPEYFHDVVVWDVVERSRVFRAEFPRHGKSIEFNKFFPRFLIYAAMSKIRSRGYQLNYNCKIPEWTSLCTAADFYL